MPTLRDPSDRAAFFARLDALTPEHERLWGTMTATRMLSHVSDQLRVALGDLPSRPRNAGFLTRRVIKPLVLYGILKAPRGKVQTVSEMLSTPETDFEQDMATLRRLIERLATAEETAPHPVFGPMSPREWGRLSAVHLDHHLRQFGV